MQGTHHRRKVVVKCVQQAGRLAVIWYLEFLARFVALNSVIISAEGERCILLTLQFADAGMHTVNT